MFGIIEYRNRGMFFAATLLIASTMLYASSPASAQTVDSSSMVRIESSLDRSLAINVEQSERPAATATQADWWSAQWIITPIPGTPFYRISARVRPTLFMNNEGQMLVTSLIQDGWWSAQWTLESADNQNWRICNRWTNECLRLINGQLALAAAAVGEPDALWVLPGYGSGTQAAAPPAAPEPAPAPAPAPAPTMAAGSAEQACFDAVQGKVAWSQGGTKQWDPANIRKLCKGATDANARVACFKNGIATHNQWAKAITECQAGGGSSTGTVANTPAASPPEKEGVSPEEHACWSAIGGSKGWGGSAEDLRVACRGVKNPPARATCFANEVEKGNAWKQAATTCNSAGLTTNKVFRLDSLLVKKTTESGSDELYLLIMGEKGRNGPRRVPEAQLHIPQPETPQISPFIETTPKFWNAYWTVGMNPSDPALRTWNTCQVLTPVAAYTPITLMVREKDDTFNRPDDQNFANKDDIIGLILFNPQASPAMDYGSHSLELNGDGSSYFATYRVAETEREFPTCKPTGFRDLGYMEVKAPASPCEKKCDQWMGGDVFGDCGIVANEACSSKAVVYLGCVAACEAAGGP